MKGALTQTWKAKVGMGWRPSEVRKHSRPNWPDRRAALSDNIYEIQHAVRYLSGVLPKFGKLQPCHQLHLAC
jgi:hypothetical protein